MNHLDANIALSLEIQAEKVQQVQAVGLDPTPASEAGLWPRKDESGRRQPVNAAGRVPVAAAVAGGLLLVLAANIMGRF